jgi:hypothetical protein
MLKGSFPMLIEVAETHSTVLQFDSEPFGIRPSSSRVGFNHQEYFVPLEWMERRTCSEKKFGREPSYRNVLRILWIIDLGLRDVLKIIEKLKWLRSHTFFGPFQYIKHFEKCTQEVWDGQSQQKQIKVFETYYPSLTRFRRSGFRDRTSKYLRLNGRAVCSYHRAPQSFTSPRNKLTIIYNGIQIAEPHNTMRRTEYQYLSLFKVSGCRDRLKADMNNKHRRGITPFRQLEVQQAPKVRRWRLRQRCFPARKWR